MDIFVFNLFSYKLFFVMVFFVVGEFLLSCKCLTDQRLAVVNVLWVKKL
jgi:hypothetical protein